MDLATRRAIAAANARRFRGRKGARTAPRRKTAPGKANAHGHAMAGHAIAGDMGDTPPPTSTTEARDPAEMTLEELREELRALGVRYSGRAGAARLAEQLREARSIGDSR